MDGGTENYGWILMKDIDGIRIESFVKRLVAKSPTYLTVHRGELLLPIPKHEQHTRDDGVPAPNYRLRRDKHTMLYCSEDNISPTAGEDLKLLDAIESPMDRFTLFASDEKLDWGSKLRAGSRVYVKVPPSHTYAAGIVCYIGPVKTLNGTNFGIEITEEAFRGKGSTDGYFQGIAYFTCDPDCGIFVSLDKLASQPRSSVGVRQTRTRANAGNQSNPKAYQIRIKIGDRVGVASKHATIVCGIVRWAGQKTTLRTPQCMHVGIHTETAVSPKDFECAVPGLEHLVAAPKGRSLIVPLSMVLSDTEVRRLKEGPKQLTQETSTPHDRPPPQDVDDTTALAQTLGTTRITLLAGQADAMHQFEQAKEVSLQKKRQEECKKAMGESVDVSQQQQLLDRFQSTHPDLSKPGKTQSASNLHPHSQNDDYLTRPPMKKQSSQQSPSAIRKLNSQQRAATLERVEGVHKTYPQKGDHSPLEAAYTEAVEDHHQVLSQKASAPSAAVSQAHLSSFHRSLSKGSTVQLPNQDSPRYGVIHWIGEIPDVQGQVAGIELEYPMDGCTDGTLLPSGMKFFHCPNGKGLYYPLDQLQPNDRVTQAFLKKENVDLKQGYGNVQHKPPTTHGYANLPRKTPSHSTTAPLPTEIQEEQQLTSTDEDGEAAYATVMLGQRPLVQGHGYGNVQHKPPTTHSYANLPRKTQSHSTTAPLPSGIQEESNFDSRPRPLVTTGHSNFESQPTLRVESAPIQTHAKPLPPQKPTDILLSQQQWQQERKVHPHDLPPRTILRPNQQQQEQRFPNEVSPRSTSPAKVPMRPPDQHYQSHSPLRISEGGAPTNQDLCSQLEATQNELKTIKATNQKLSNQLESSKYELTQTKDSNQKLSEQLESANHKIAGMEVSIKTVSERIENISQELTEEKHSNEQLTQTNLEQTRTNQQLAQQLETANGQLAKFQAENERSSHDIEPWKVSCSKVEMGAEIARGGWGTISKGKVSVAIKEMHSAIVHQSSIDQFHREMQILSQVRHPNLVQFIGAVFDQENGRPREIPLILIELLDVNLRKAYEEGRLRGDHKLSIFKDVAKALKYLHERYEPIIHRDVSAPNVLLEALPDGNWKGKLSDLGSANYLKHAQTYAPGAILYAAPETFPTACNPDAPPAAQTFKLDVYSFGVMLCEVMTNRFPKQEDNADMLRQVQCSCLPMYNLIRKCTEFKQESRPEMAAVLSTLDNVPRLP